MKLYIVLVSEDSGPAFAYNDHPLLFTDEDVAKWNVDQFDKDMDKAVYMYEEDVDFKSGDKIYVLSVGWYDDDEYVNKEVKFFKTEKERDDYASILDDEYNLCKFEYYIR